VGSPTHADRFDELIPRWMFGVRPRAARIALAVAVPLLVEIAFVVTDRHDLRVAPILAAGLVLVAVLAGSSAVAIAGVIALAVYWWDAIPPSGSFAVPGASEAFGVLGMAVLVVALPLITRRVEQIVDDVRALDLERIAAVESQRAARETAERLAEQTQAALDMSTMLADAHTAAAVAESVLDNLALPETPTDASIGLVRDNHMRILAARGTTPDVIEAIERVRVDRSPWLGAVIEGEPAFVEDRDKFAIEFPTAKVLSLYPIGSWAVLPFRSKAAVGLLSVHYWDPQPLKDHETYLSLVAELLAAALERAIAEEGQARQVAALEQTLAERDRIARTLSTTLLPPQLPPLHGFEAEAWLVPASTDEVAGDFYDLFAVGEGDWVAILGDVCGKGAEAAAVTSLARYAARTTALVEPRPAGVAKMANLALNRDSSDLFCTMAIVHYERDSSTISVTLAGHPQARHISNGKATRIGRFGAPLGLTIGAPVDDRYPLEVGDTLLLFSDGLIERSPHFDEDALDELLNEWGDIGARELVHRLQAQVETLDVVHPDDVAVLAVTLRSH
jgi:sigma-B regulation protein RsbU (phosphoserine phosphatase)